VTHGNGPQVGFILRRSEIAAAEVPVVPMDYATADTQGAIGFLFQKAFAAEFRRLGLDRQAVALVTQVRVDPADPSFQAPEKPIGPFFTGARGRALAAQLGWRMIEDSGRGFRRVVPSPQPQEVLELPLIRDLLERDRVVVACGGGGVPVAWTAEGLARCRRVRHRQHGAKGQRGARLPRRQPGARRPGGDRQPGPARRPRRGHGGHALRALRERPAPGRAVGRIPPAPMTASPDLRWFVYLLRCGDAALVATYTAFQSNPSLLTDHVARFAGCSWPCRSPAHRVASAIRPRSGPGRTVRPSALAPFGPSAAPSPNR
jgi:hypothetical protein